MKQLISSILPVFLVFLSTYGVKAENLVGSNPCEQERLNCTNNNRISLLKIASSNWRDQVTSLRERSFEYRYAKNYSQAIELMQQALDLAQQAGDLDVEWWARTDLAEIYKDSGNLSKALELHQQNLGLVQQNLDHFKSENYSQQTQSLAYLSKVYTLLKNYPKALELLNQALTIEKTFKGWNSSAITANVLQELGINLLLNGNMLGAESTLLEAAKIYENARNQGTYGGAIGFQYESEIELNRWLQQIFIAQNRTNEALELAEQNRAREFVALVANRLNANTKFEQPINAPNLEEIKQIAKSQNATLVQYSLTYDYNSAWRLAYDNEEEIKPTNLFIWVIKPTGEIIFRRKSLDKETISLAELVRQGRESIGARGRSLGVVARVEDTPPKPQQRQINYLNKLHQVLIQPIADILPNNPSDRVVFIPQDFLFLVPFAALQDGNDNYLIEKHTLLLSPSIQVLDLTRKQQQNIDDSLKGVMIVGNPTMPSLSPKQGIPPQQLPSLPGSEQEANAIAQLFNTQPLIGEQATKEAVLQRLSEARIIHFATHGILDDVFGAFSSLALAPTHQDNGFLLAREIIGMKLNAELAVLSACNTGRGKINGDGILGLSRSFLAAGVPSIIVSLWSVPDAPTASLMTAFYENIKRGSDKAQALRQGMLETMKRFPDPINWAAFTLIGEGNSSSILQTATGDVPANTQAVPTSYYTVLPVPDHVSNYFELPSQMIEGQIDISFKTTSSVEELVNFYRNAFQERGLPENTDLTHISEDSFQLVFTDSPNRRTVVIQSSSWTDDLISVFVRVEPMRPAVKLPSWF